MRRVLLDGTTLMSASRLLDGEEKPNALNFWSLSLLLECLILHDEIIVLDTSYNDQRLSAAALKFGNFIHVENRSIKELIDPYIEMEFPRLSGLSSLSVEQRQRVRQMGGDYYYEINRAEQHLSSILKNDYSNDEGMTDYLDILKKAHVRQLAKARERKRRKRLFSLISFSPMPTTPNNDGTTIGTICGDADICNAWENFVERYTNASDQSPWHDMKEARQSSTYRFTPALLIRTHLLPSRLRSLGCSVPARYIAGTDLLEIFWFRFFR